MLIDPQPLDVDVSYEERSQKHDGNHAEPCLDIQAAAKSSSCDDQRPCRARNTQQQDDISVYSMCRNELVSNDRQKLKDDKTTSWEETRKMEKHARAVQPRSVVVALAGTRSTSRAESRATEDIVDVDEHETSKDEAKQGTAEEEVEK